MAPTVVYLYFGSAAQFVRDSANTSTALYTNLQAGYLVQVVTPYGQASDGAPSFMWTLEFGGLPL